MDRCFSGLLILLVCFSLSCRWGFSESPAVIQDAGYDAGVDAGLDAGGDTGLDAGEDAGQDAGQDAGSDSGDGADAGPVGPDPDPFVDQYWFGPVEFGQIEELTALNSAGREGEPYLAPGGLILHFSSDRTGNADVYRTSRTAPGLSFTEAPVPVDWINTDASETRYALRFDELEVIVSAVRDGGLGDSDLWQYTRASTGKPFVLDSAEHLEHLSTDAAEWDPFLSQDGLRLYFASTGQPDGPGGGGDLFMAERSALDQPFGPPVLMAVVNSDAAEGNPSLSADERVIVFNSNRTDGAGGSDIYYAVRQDFRDDFETPQLVGGVNTVESEGEPFLSPDARELFFIVITGSNTWDLHRAVIVE